MKSDKPSSPLFKALITVGIILLMPFGVMKITQLIKNENKVTQINLDDEKKMNAAFERYLNNNRDKILSMVMDSYYEKYLTEKNSEKLVNSIILYHRILFNEKLPKILSKQKDSMNIMMFFSDFDSVLPILEKLNEIQDKSQINIYFRQIVTQNKFSSIIARYGQAIFQINPELFIPYYLSALKIPKAELSQEKIDNILKDFNLDTTQVQNIANSQDIENLIKETNDLAKKLSVNQLPAWIMENGRMVFGVSGFEIIKNLMNEENQNQ
jgi:hypothetical protein